MRFLLAEATIPLIGGTTIRHTEASHGLRSGIRRSTFSQRHDLPNDLRKPLHDEEIYGYGHADSQANDFSGSHEWLITQRW
jgi:hypothetical protein